MYASRSPSVLVLVAAAAYLAGAETLHAQAPHGGTGVPPIPAHPLVDWTVVLNALPPRLSIVDNRTHSLVRVLPTHRNDWMTAINVELSKDGRAAYVMHADNSIQRLFLDEPSPQPVAISPGIGQIAPGYPILMRDLEISPDGRYLVATAADHPAWMGGIPVPRNRISIYDLANPGPGTHLYLDTIVNDTFLAELEVTIDGSNRAFVSDGDWQTNVMVDLATATITGGFKASDTVPVDALGGGTVQYLLPSGTLGMTANGPTWIAYDTLTGHGVLRHPNFATGGVADTFYSNFDLREIEARASTPIVALSRPKSAALVGPAPDEIVVVDPVNGTRCGTPHELGWHRFREIEFLREFDLGRVYGIDVGANTFLTGDFSLWVANPATTQGTLTTLAISQTTFRFRLTSDGLLDDGGDYVVHDAKASLAWIHVLPNPMLVGVIDLLPGGETRNSVDLELTTQNRCHQD